MRVPQSLKKILACICCLAFVSGAWAELKDIKLSAADIPAFKKKHPEAKLKQTKAVNFNGTVYWAEVYTIDTLDNFCKGWINLQMIITNEPEDLSLLNPLRVKNKITPERVNRYMQQNNYYGDYLNTAPGVVQFSPLPDPSKISYVNFNFYRDYEKNRTDSIFEQSGGDLKFETYEEVNDSLLLVEIPMGKFNSLECQGCYITAGGKSYNNSTQRAFTRSIRIFHSWVKDFRLEKDTISGDVEIENSTVNFIGLNSSKVEGNFKIEKFHADHSDGPLLLAGQETPVFSLFVATQTSFLNNCILEQEGDWSLYEKNDLKYRAIRISSSVFIGAFRISTQIAIESESNQFSNIFQLENAADTLSGFYLHALHSKFTGAVIINRRFMNYTAFTNSTFSGLFTVDEPLLSSFTVERPDSNYIKAHKLDQLANCSFNKNTKLLVNPGEEFKAFQLQLYNIDNIDLLFKNGPLPDSVYLKLAEEARKQNTPMFRCQWLFADSANDDLSRNANAYIGAMQEYVAKNPTTDIDLKSNVLDKVHYWKDLLQMDNLYVQHHYLNWALYQIPKITANFGYNGSWFFVGASFIIVFVLSILFFVSGRQKVVNYVALGGDIKEDFETQFGFVNQNPVIPQGVKYDVQLAFRQWVSCFWLCAFIFVNPKFPLKFFYIRGWLFAWMCVCWFFGLVMLLILLIFIAAKASFIRTLLAL